MNARKTIIYLLVATAVIFIGHYFYENYKLNSFLGGGIPERDGYRELTEGDSKNVLAEAKTLESNKDPGKAVLILDELKNRTEDMLQKSIIDLEIANTKIRSIDLEEGVEALAKIVNNENYPRVSRAYAMILIADRFQADLDKKLLKPFFSEQELALGREDTLITESFKKSYDIYPLGYSAGKLGTDYLLKKINISRYISDEDYVVALGYFKEIDLSMVQLENSEGMRHLIPSTLLMRAHMLRLLSFAGRPQGEDISKAYQKVLEMARAMGAKRTEQFAVLFYADYLARLPENITSVTKVLEENFEKATLDNMVIRYVNNLSLLRRNFPNIYKYTSNDKNFGDLFGLLFHSRG